MSVLLDTNILTRLAEPGHAAYRAAFDATELLRNRGETICVVPQCLYEFWVVCTRPLSANGLGKTLSETVAEMSNFQHLFVLLPDAAGIFQLGSNSLPNTPSSAKKPTMPASSPP